MLERFPLSGVGPAQAYPSAGQAAAFQYANAVYIASMNSNQLVPDMAYGAQKYWDNSSVCTNPQGCQGFRCGEESLSAIDE